MIIIDQNITHLRRKIYKFLVYNIELIYKYLISEIEYINFLFMIILELIFHFLFLRFLLIDNYLNKIGKNR